jgi:hypothetical protein
MRAAVAAALTAAFLLVAAGCGTSSAATGMPGQDAAALAPPSAVAFVSANANLDSQGWKTLTKIYPIALDANLARDFREAVGDELNLAVLDFEQGKPEVIAIVKSKDKTKLRSLAARFDQGDEHYTVEDIAGWQVVADSPANFQAVRDAGTGSSLADSADFKHAVAQLDGDALAFAFGKGSVVQKLPANVRTFVGTPRWLAARVVADKDDARLDVRAAGGKQPPVYKPTMLRDAPSGSALAVSFKNVNQLRAVLPPSLLPDVKGLSGEGVFSVSGASLLPVVTLEVRPKDPAAAAKSLRALAARVKSGLQLQVKRDGAKVVLTNATGFGTGSSLMDDKAFKDAVAAADVPKDVTWLAYADMPRLAPLIQAFSALAGKGQQKADKSNLRLDKLGTVVAYGARAGSGSQLVVRTTVR